MYFQEAMDSAMDRDQHGPDWDIFSDSLRGSLNRLEDIVNDVTDMREVCQDEWCEATECLLGEATVAAFAISEPHWNSEQDSNKLKELKKRIHDLHANRKGMAH